MCVTCLHGILAGADQDICERRKKVLHEGHEENKNEKKRNKKK